MSDTPVNYEDYAIKLCALLDLIEAQEDIDGVRAVCRCRFAIAESCGINVVFEGGDSSEGVSWSTQ